MAALGTFMLEMAVYAVFVLAYFGLVLHFLGAWLKFIFDSNRVLYAILALGLIGVQGFLLEVVSSTLLRLIQRNAR